MIRLEQPSIAANDLRIVSPDGKHATRYHMWRTWDLSQKHLTPRQTIISYVATLARSAPGGKVKNLVISCHGSPGHLLLGEGFGPDDTGMFFAWEGLIDTIWLTACQVALGEEGRRFCSNMAGAACSDIIASTETQVSNSATYPYGLIDEFEGLVGAFSPATNGAYATGRNPSAWLDRHGNWHQYEPSR
jgi:hypothetical protein